MVVLTTGDILLVHTDSPSNWLSMIRFGSWWTHSAVMYDAQKTVEMTHKNVRNLTFSKRYEGKKIRIIRLKGLTIWDRIRIRKESRRLMKLKFDRLRLVIPLLPQMRRGRFWCSSFIDLLYKKATGRVINVKRMMQDRSGYLEEIGAEIIYDYRGKR